MSNVHLLDRPEFVAWYLEVVSLVKDGGHTDLDMSYKGLWVDLYDNGFTPADAIKEKSLGR